MDAGWRRNYLRYKSFFLNMLTQYRERSDWKAYLEILLSLTTVSVFSIFALRPTILTIAELIQQIEEKKATVIKIDAKIQNLGKAQTLYDRQRPNILLLTDSVVPKNPQSDVLARQIEGLSAQNQIPVSSFSFGEAVILGESTPKVTQETEDEEKTDPVLSNSSQMDFSLTSVLDINNYPSVLNFLAGFEKMRMPPKIKTAEISVRKNPRNGDRELVLILDGEITYLNIQNKINQE
jgi:hypothetical protein